MTPYYSTESFIVYLLFCFYFVFSIRHGLIAADKLKKSHAFILQLIIVSSIFSSFRYINRVGIGGADAFLYADYFENPQGYTNAWSEHVDAGYKIISNTVRIIYSDYHFFFILCYGFITYSYYAVFKEFTPKDTNWTPYVLLIHPFILSFNTLRTSLAISFLLLSLVLFQKGKNGYAIIFALISTTVHKLCFLYIIVLPFIKFYIHRRLNVSTILFVVIILSVVSASISDLMGAALDAIGGTTESHYGYYLTTFEDSSFVDGAIRTSIEQIILGVLLLVFNKQIIHHIEMQPYEMNCALKFVWLVVVFDIILIPVNYIAGNWRSPEFFATFRIVMWGQVLCLLFRKFDLSNRIILSIGCLIVFILRIYLAFKGQAESAGIMPYIFEPFVI